MVDVIITNLTTDQPSSGASTMIMQSLHGYVGTQVILRMFHVTACFFVFFAGQRLMKTLQDPGLYIPGIL